MKPNHTTSSSPSFASLADYKYTSNLLMPPSSSKYNLKPSPSFNSLASNPSPYNTSLRDTNVSRDRESIKNEDIFAYDRSSINNTYNPSTPSLVGFSPALFPMHSEFSLTNSNHHRTSFSTEFSLNPRSSISGLTASPQLSSLNNPFRPSNTQSSISASSPFGFGSIINNNLNPLNSHPSSISLMGGILGNRDNEERSMLSWRDRYALPTNPSNKRNSIPNIDEVPLNLSEDNINMHDSTPTKSNNTNIDIQQNAAGSPLSIGIIGIQAFSKSSQKRNVKFENNNSPYKHSASSPSLQAMLDAPPIDFMSPSLGASHNAHLHHRPSIHNIPLLSPSLRGQQPRDSKVDMEAINSIRILNNGDVADVIKVPDNPHSFDPALLSHFSDDAIFSSNSEFLAAASSLCGFSPVPLPTLSPPAPTRATNNSSTKQPKTHAPPLSPKSATLAGTLLPATGNGSGTSCHQCKSRRGMNNLIYCSNIFNKRSDEKRQSCRKKYCENCLKRFYNEKPPDQKTNPSCHWPCPACRELCSCAACRRNKTEGDTPLKDANPDENSSLPRKKSTPKASSTEKDSAKKDLNKKKVLGKKRSESPNSGLDLIADIASSPDLSPVAPNKSLDESFILSTNDVKTENNLNTVVAAANTKIPSVPPFQNLFEQQKAQYLQQLLYVQQQMQLHQLHVLQQTQQNQNKETMTSEQFTNLQQSHSLQMAATQAQLQQQMQQFMANASGGASNASIPPVAVVPSTPNVPVV